MPAKSSPTDYIPTSLLISWSDVFSEIISHLANLSFYHVCFPSSFKVVQVIPRIKKPGSDKDDTSNYNPFSNLNTISKISVRLFLSRILPPVTSSHNFNPYQSAYRRSNSTETTFILVLIVFKTIDRQESTILVSLDLSSFDTIAHNTLISRLHTSFGISGATLQWITSYHSDRS